MSVPYLVSQNIPKPAPITPSSAAISGLSDKGREAISAAQIAHPEYYHNNFKDAFNSFATKVVDTFKDDTQAGSPPRASIPHSAESVHSSPVTPAVLDYLNAEIAKHYGMSKETAYQEALSNTSYQRAVKDMQAAGLNPAVIYGAGRGSTASGVGYVSEFEDHSGGGSGGGYYSGGSSSKGHLFDKGTWGAIGTAAGLIGMAVTKSPTGFWIGQTTAQGIMGAMNSLFG